MPDYYMDEENGRSYRVEDWPSVDDTAKERDWSYLEREARDFRKKYGAAALLRCVSYALEDRSDA